MTNPVDLGAVLDPPQGVSLDGTTGTILAIPPFGERREAWTFRVDGCTCASSSHHSLTAAEYCSQQARNRTTACSEIDDAVRVLARSHVTVEKTTKMRVLQRAGWKRIPINRSECWDDPYGEALAPMTLNGAFDLYLGRLRRLDVP